MGWAAALQAPADAGSLPRTTPGIAGPTDADQGGNSGNIQQMVQQFLAGKPPGAQTLQALKAYMAQQGINIDIPTHGGGQLSDDKIVLPNQQVIDLWGDVGGANSQQWADDGFWVNGQPSATPGVVTQSPDAGGFGGYGGVSLDPMSGVAPFTAQGLIRPYDKEFSFTPQDYLNSPDYQFLKSEGIDAVQQSAAGRGVLNTTGTLKNLASHVGGIAAQGLNDYFGRQLGMQGFNRGTYWGNQDNAYNKLAGNAQLGLNAATNYANNVSATQASMGGANAANAVNRGNNWAGLIGNAADIFGGIFASRGK